MRVFTSAYCIWCSDLQSTPRTRLLYHFRNDLLKAHKQSTQRNFDWIFWDETIARSSLAKNTHSMCNIRRSVLKYYRIHIWCDTFQFLMKTFVADRFICLFSEMKQWLGAETLQVSFAIFFFLPPPRILTHKTQSVSHIHSKFELKTIKIKLIGDFVVAPFLFCNVNRFRNNTYVFYWHIPNISSKEINSLIVI